MAASGVGGEQFESRLLLSSAVAAEISLVGDGRDASPVESAGQSGQHREANRREIARNELRHAGQDGVDAPSLLQVVTAAGWSNRSSQHSSSAYSNPVNEFIGENFIRPLLGDDVLTADDGLVADTLDWHEDGGAIGVDLHFNIGVIWPFWGGHGVVGGQVLIQTNSWDTSTFLYGGAGIDVGLPGSTAHVSTGLVVTSPIDDLSDYSRCFLSQGGALIPPTWPLPTGIEYTHSTGVGQHGHSGVESDTCSLAFGVPGTSITPVEGTWFWEWKDWDCPL